MNVYEIGDLRVRPGTRGDTWLEVAKTPTAGAVGIPLVVVHGVEPGPVLLVDAATHGDEYEGTLSLLTFLRDLDPTRLRGTFLAVPVLNGPAFEAETRGNPLERHHYDLNRAYPGEAGGGITQRIVARYFSDVVRRASAVVSLHGGGNVFYLDGFVIAHTTTGSSLELIRAMGWRRFTDAPDVAVNPYQGTLHEKCAEIGIPVLVAELGGASHRSPSHLERMKGEFIRGLRNVLIHFNLIDGAPQRPETLWKIKKQNIRARNGGVADILPGVDIEAEVEQGQPLIRIYDPFGALVDELRAPYGGRVMALPASPLAYPGRILTSVYQVVEEVPAG